MWTIALESIYIALNDDPFPTQHACISRQLAVFEDVQQLSRHLIKPDGPERPLATLDVADLFEHAWASFSNDGYDHSVSLVERRLRLSGLDEKFFKGKMCFDGGCGSGRLSIAMAAMNASEVVAADLGQASLDYLQRQAARRSTGTIKPTQCDVTDLRGGPDATFDFVASYGVLHHTPNPLGGLREHFRVLKPGGTLWLYLYGAGGIYWDVYDQLRDVIGKFSVSHVKAALSDMKVREGLCYTFLDNVLAPSQYYLESDIIAFLRKDDPGLVWRRATGSSVVDDVDMSLATKHGKEIIGPEGEVRVVVTKSRQME